LYWAEQAKSGQSEEAWKVRAFDIFFFTEEEAGWARISSDMGEYGAALSVGSKKRALNA